MTDESNSEKNRVPTEAEKEAESDPCAVIESLKRQVETLQKS